MKEDVRLIIRKRVGERIRQIRTHRNLSLRDLEAISGIDYSWLGKLETGKVNFSMDSLTKLMKALKIQPGDLFDFKVTYKDED